MILFKGKKAKGGPVRTSDIKLSDIREVFFPSNFYEKYKYLGCVPYDNERDIFKALEPLVIFMDCELPTHGRADGLGFGSQHSY